MAIEGSSASLALVLSMLMVGGLGGALGGAFGCASSDSTVDPEPVLSCRIVVAEEIAEGAPVVLRFELENRGNRPLWVLRWNTPFDPLQGDVFEIHRGDPTSEKLAFTGPMVKRGDPLREEYLEISPGKTLTAEIDLRASYEFRGAGSYEVRFDSLVADLAESAVDLPHARDQHRSFDLACGPTTFRVR